MVQAFGTSGLGTLDFDSLLRGRVFFEVAVLTSTLAIIRIYGAKRQNHGEYNVTREWQGLCLCCLDP